MKPILSVKDLKVEFATYGGTVKAVRGVSFDLLQGEVLAVVGESGCGKSVTFQTLMGLIPTPPGKVTHGTAEFENRDLLKLPRREMEKVRGKKLGMIFQDPLSSLNPTMTVGAQIAEVLIEHEGLSAKAARIETIKLMKMVQIPEADNRVDQYPHEFSGGMRQRIMIAIALACKPKILIADEPTTALDVTIQGQILELLKKLRKEIGMSIIIVTHDLGVVASIADRVAVMYAGEIVETGTAEQIFANPSHPYTLGLLKAKPNPAKPNLDDLRAIPGSPPDLFAPPTGCSFAARCPYAMEVCMSFNPPTFYPKGDTHLANCWIHHQQAPSVVKEAAIHAI